VIDDFAGTLSMEQVSSACQAVGFNTIPAWLRPFYVLSNGERFRVELARRLLELSDPIVVDEFTSVVDRQVAQIGAHAVQKYVRRNKRKFVAVSCHYDIVDWLQPDWIFEPATMHFARKVTSAQASSRCHGLSRPLLRLETVRSVSLSDRGIASRGQVFRVVCGGSDHDVCGNSAEAGIERKDERRGHPRGFPRGHASRLAGVRTGFRAAG
jgi:hypothetical protein